MRKRSRGGEWLAFVRSAVRMGEDDVASPEEKFSDSCKHVFFIKLIESSTRELLAGSLFWRDMRLLQQLNEPRSGTALIVLLLAEQLCERPFTTMAPPHRHLVDHYLHSRPARHRQHVA
jgi:hypothetical protein